MNDADLKRAREIVKVYFSHDYFNGVHQCRSDMPMLWSEIAKAFQDVRDETINDILNLKRPRTLEKYRDSIRAMKDST